jgi:RNA polymerase sigma factor (sigma-70 family)
MASESVDASSLKHFPTLCRVGVVGNLSDGQLLDSFLTAEEETSEASFAALLDRHGPMVLRVCRQILGNTDDAQDAFQATFLVLVHRAGSVRKRDSVACWLYGTAQRVARRFRVDAARRRSHERRWATMAKVGHMDPAIEPECWPELHDELSRLPDKYRESVVLCYLEGLSTQAAAQRLGCPQGTVLSRLSRAREQLRKRLTRRGLTVPAGLLAAGLATETAKAAVPSALARVVIQTAVASPLHKTAGSGAISASVSQLTRGVLRTMFFTKLRTAAAAIIVVAALATGAGVLLQKTPEPWPEAVLAAWSPALQAQPPKDFMKHPALRDSTVVPKDLAWSHVPPEERLQVLDMLVARSKANYEKIKTWSGTYHIDSQERLSRKFVSSFPLAPPNSGPLIHEREFTLKFAIDLNSTLFLDERTIQQATFKPGTREAVTKPNLDAFARWLFILYKDKYMERIPEDGELIVGAPGQAPVIRKQRRAVMRPVEEGRRSIERINPRQYFGHGPSRFVWSEAEFLAQALRGHDGEARRQRAENSLSLWQAGVPGGPWYWQTFNPGHSSSDAAPTFSTTTIWSPQAGYNPVLHFSSFLGRPDSPFGDITEWTWNRFEETYLPTDYKHDVHDAGGSLDHQTHAKLEDCALNKALDPQPDMNNWLGLTDGDLIWSESDRAEYKVQGDKLVQPD